MPTAIRGEAGSWLFILVTTQAIAPVWFAPRALSVPLAIMPGIAFGAGTALAPATGLVTASPRRAALALLFVVVATHWLIRQMLCGRATRADAGLAAADTEARDQYVILSGNIERREQDRLMHDTILNTLTAIARSGGTPAAISQCRQDIGLLQSALSDSGTTHDRGRAGPGPVGVIETVVGEMRARGLAVDLEITGGAAAQGIPEPGVVPGPRQTVQRRPKWTCSIEPLRTGISLHRPSYGIPPSGQGQQEIPVLDARSPGSLGAPCRTVMTPMRGSRWGFRNWSSSTTTAD